MDWHSNDTDVPLTTQGSGHSTSPPAESPVQERISDRSCNQAGTTPVSANFSLAVDGFASLAVQDTRRHGLYGAEAFQMKHPQSPLFQATQTQPSHGHTTYSTSQLESPRPAKVLKTATQIHPSSLTENETFNDRPGPVGDQSTIASRTKVIHRESHFSLASQVDSESSRDSLSSPVQSRELTQQPLSLKTVTLRKAGTDVDRDDQGDLCKGPPPNVVMASPFTASSIQHEDNRPYGAASSSKKRKHTEVTNDTLPPPPFIWQGTTDPQFTAFQGLLLFPELCFILTGHLPLRDLISLYSISRDFHAIIDRRFTTSCLTVANKRAPTSAQIFYFRMYAYLCRPDPANRIPHPDPIKAAAHQPRMIPSFRWVAFVLFREKVVHELMTIFAENAVPLPPRCGIAIKKMWLIMDIPDNARRIGMIHNRKIITDLDLYYMFCFVVKLDMLCHDPIAAEKHNGLRKLMLSQRDGILSVLLVLKRVQWKTHAELLLAWIRYACEIGPAQENDDFDAIDFGAETIFGIPIKQAGLGKYEYWGRRGAIRRVVPNTGEKQRYSVLMRPDQLIMREAVRRRLQLSRVALKTVLAGYIDNDSLDSIPATPYSRRIPEWNDEEYMADDLIGGACAVPTNQGGDPLLDLGECHTTAPHIIAQHQDQDQYVPSSAGDIMATRTNMIRQHQDSFLDKCMDFVNAEMENLNGDDPITQEELEVLPPLA